MAKERARRRAEREAEEQRERERRAREREREARRRERRERRRQVMSSLVPGRGTRDRGRPRVKPGILARRHRRRLLAFAAVICAIQVLTWPFIPTWGGRLVVLALTLLAAPVAWVLSFGRV